MAELLDKNRHFTCPNYKNIVVLIFKGEEIMYICMDELLRKNMSDALDFDVTSSNILALS